MIPPDDHAKDLPKANPEVSSEISPKDEDSKDTSKPQERGFPQTAQGPTHLATSAKKSGIAHSPNSANPISPLEEVLQSLRKKANEAAGGLESVFGQKAIDQAKESWKNRKVKDIKKAATNYLRRSGRGCKIDQAELVKEILTIANIGIPAYYPRKSGKQTGVSKSTKGSGNDVKQGVSTQAVRNDTPLDNVGTHSADKSRSLSSLEEVRQSLRKKANEAAVGLESVFGQEVINRAKESLINRKVEDIKKAATNYLIKSGKACKINQADLVKEILKTENIKIPTKSSKKSGKKTGSFKGTKGSMNGVKEGGPPNA